MTRKSGHFRTDLHKLPIPKHLDTAKIFLFHRKEPCYNDIPRFLPVHTSQKKSESKIKMSTENETSVLVLIFTPFIQK